MLCKHLGRMADRLPTGRRRSKGGETRLMSHLESSREGVSRQRLGVRCPRTALYPPPRVTAYKAPQGRRTPRPVGVLSRGGDNSRKCHLSFCSFIIAGDPDVGRLIKEFQETASIEAATTDRASGNRIWPAMRISTNGYVALTIGASVSFF
jgi:hypothetical protein